MQNPKVIKYKGYIIEKDTAFRSMNDCRIKNQEGKILLRGLKTIQNAKDTINEKPYYFED